MNNKAKRIAGAQVCCLSAHLTHAMAENRYKKSPHPRRGVSEGGDPEGNPPPMRGRGERQSVSVSLTGG